MSSSLAEPLMNAAWSHTASQRRSGVDPHDVGDSCLRKVQGAIRQASAAFRDPWKLTKDGDGVLARGGSQRFQLCEDRGQDGIFFNIVRFAFHVSFQALIILPTALLRS